VSDGATGFEETLRRVPNGDYLQDRLSF